MPDDKQACDRSERMQLNLDDEQEVIDMARSFCVTTQELRAAVQTTGTDVCALEEHFRAQ